MEISFWAILIRKFLFGLAVGVGFYAVMLYGKAMLERAILNRKIEDNAYFWGGVIISIFLAILAMIFI
ncbi:MAG TPA: hypothetical protein PL093_00390 [Candidatus Pacearchaeota archaeon]|nr:hypothetical protein [Candidatus Pacearchaeota archaeon]HRR94644.1 hypothetical protein [Candidatus Paceibacterota bacterium]HPC30350.1 hypothetical protein [Candidatus Pacearchaeota archaeon]HQG09040.1 hypothetical protein [Candidatus Pacearchaeota archaeon]HQH20021.1 hypothetical protein [Candidatus Pacearchaeota archaeon]